MENVFMSINDLVFAPVNAIKEADISLSSGIIKQIATFSDTEDEKTDTPIMKLKKMKFLYEKLKSDENGDRIETIGLTIPTASIIPLSALKISSSVVKFNIEVKSDYDDSSNMALKGKTAPNTFRKSDHLPKMSFKIKTEATELPEGIARLIDVLDANQVPCVENKVYINSDGMPHSNQEIYSAKDQAMEEIKNINLMINKMETALSSFDKKLNSPQKLYAADMDKLNTGISELKKYLEKYYDIKVDKEKKLLLAEMSILEDKTHYGE